MESILVKYNLLLIPPQLDKPQTYTISIRVASQLATRKRMEEHFFGEIPKIIRIMNGRTLLVEIEYTDYVVARAILSLIDEWQRVIPRDTESRMMKLMQAKSYLIPRSVKFITAIFATFLVVKTLPHFLSSDQPNLLLFGQIFSYASISVFSAYCIAGWFARVLESSIDRWTPLSFVKLNKGDDVAIAASEEANRNNIIKGGVAPVSWTETGQT